jgi:hypothetical protein
VLIGTFAAQFPSQQPCRRFGEIFPVSLPIMRLASASGLSRWRYFCTAIGDGRQAQHGRPRRFRHGAFFNVGKLREIVHIDENERGSRPRDTTRISTTASVVSQADGSGILPPRSRSATSTSAPDASSLKGESLDFVRILLGNDGSRLCDYLDRPKVQALVASSIGCLQEFAPAGCELNTRSCRYVRDAQG